MPSNDTSRSGKSQSISAMVTVLIFCCFFQLREVLTPSIRAMCGSSTLLGASKLSFVTVPSVAILWDSSAADPRSNSRAPPQAV